MSFTSNHNEWIWFRTKWFIWEMSNSTRLQLHSMKLRHISWSARFGSIVSKPTHIAVYDLVLALFLLWQSYRTVLCTMAFALKKKKKNLNEYTSEEAKKRNSLKVCHVSDLGTETVHTSFCSMNTIFCLLFFSSSSSSLYRSISMLFSDYNWFEIALNLLYRAIYNL